VPCPPDDEPPVTGLEQRVLELEAENKRLRQLLGLDRPDRASAISAWEPRLLSLEAVTSQVAPSDLNHSSSPEEKVAFYRSLFFGRQDVYAVRWDNNRSGKSGWSPAVRGGWANARRPDRELLPLTEEVVTRHLAGEIHAGLYPLLRDDRCGLLACDFDGPGWVLDALAFHDAARATGIPVALERSRSGDGAHVWMFFSQPVSAASARRIGFHVLREAMAGRAEIDLTSYDRLFPSQDFLPKGSFGNLIALPLQGDCRRRGTTVFVDPTTLEPHADQWAFLSSLDRMSAEAVDSLASNIKDIGVGPGAATYRAPRSSRTEAKPPPTIIATEGAMLAVDRVGLPPSLIASLKHLASLHNPKFYENERLRFSNHDTPRFVRCYRESMGELLLPRGLREQVGALVLAAGSELEIRDACPTPGPVGFELSAVLSSSQQSAFDELSRHELGVFVAPPGTGKTVLACALIAHFDRPTLVIVDRKPLVQQWRDRLSTHLGLPSTRIGQLGAPRDRQFGAVDVAMVQSLARREDLEMLTAGYGFVVVDECHHVPAVTFERCVRQIPVRRWLGLTATPYRRDGLQGMITMYCGPIRHDATRQSRDDDTLLELIVHSTNHDSAVVAELAIQDVFRGVVEDAVRTTQICADVMEALQRGRNCLVLTQWTVHLESIVECLEKGGSDCLVLRGGMGKKARADVLHQLDDARPGSGLVVVATGSYLGEGFDCPPLDSLFLAFPLAFKGRLVQYIGRVMRPLEGKTSVEVHDYLDAAVPVLARMHAKRASVFLNLGFRERASSTSPADGEG